jgi:long-subunit acyl-CoA synthetase (AMP-forming)
MPPLDDKTKVVLPLSWVATAAVSVTITVCFFFWSQTEKLKSDIAELKTDVAVLKAVIAPASVTGKVAIK